MYTHLHLGTYSFERINSMEKKFTLDYYIQKKTHTHGHKTPF